MVSVFSLSLAAMVFWAPASEWSKEALKSVPSAVAAPNGTPWTIRRSEGTRAGGVGSDASEIGDIKQGWLKLYALPKDENVSAQANVRALFYSLFYTLDQTYRWSERAKWRELNGWQGYLSSYMQPLPHAKNRQTPDYLLHSNEDSPRHDFASFMAWYLSASKENESDSPLCRYLSHARFAHAILKELDASFPNKLGDPFKECHGFKQWAKYDAIGRIEINYATPLTKSATSSFGHIYLRIVYDDAQGYHPIAHSKSISFLANTSSHAQGSMGYILGGLFGAFRARLHLQPFWETYQTYVVKERRDIVQWRINFSPQEQKRFLERVWTLRNKAEYQYFFLQENCSTLLIDLLNSALPLSRQVKQPGVMGKGPTKALDQLALAKAESGGSLLTLIPNRLLSMKSAAAQANAALKQIELELAKHLRASEMDLLLEVHSEDDAARIRAYQHLKPALGRLVVSREKLVREYFLQRGIIESYFSSKLNVEREKQSSYHYAETIRELHGILPSQARAWANKLAQKIPNQEEQTVFLTGVDAMIDNLDDADDAIRNEGYEAVAAFIGGAKFNEKEMGAFIEKLRCVALLQLLLNNDDLRTVSPRLYNELFFPVADLTLSEQPYVQSYQGMFREANSTLVSDAVLVLQKTKAEVFSRRKSSQSQKMASSNFVSSTDADLALKDYERAYLHGKVDGVSAAMGSIFSGEPLRRGETQLALTSAVYNESLGAPTRHGNNGDKALTLLANESWWSVEDGWPVIRRGALTLIGYREMVIPELEIQPSPYGWEFYVTAQFQPWESVERRYFLGATGILQLAGTRQLVNHLLFTQGVDLESRFASSNDTPPQWGVTAPLGLEARIGLAEDNSYQSLSFMGRLIPFWEMRTTDFILGWEAKAECTYPLFDQFRVFSRTKLGVGLYASVVATGVDLENKPEEMQLRAAFGLRIH